MAAASWSFLRRVSGQLMNSRCLSTRTAILQRCHKFYGRFFATRVQAKLKSTATTVEKDFTQECKNDNTDVELDFEWRQLQTAYGSKRIEDILRAIFVLKLCSYDTFVANCMQVSARIACSSACEVFEKFGISYIVEMSEI